MRKSEPVTAYPEGLVQCPNCEVFFKPAKPNHHYCGSTCRVAAFRRRQVQELRAARAELVRLNQKQAWRGPSPGSLAHRGCVMSVPVVIAKVGRPNHAAGPADRTIVITGAQDALDARDARG